jgi:hypothetical protein
MPPPNDISGIADAPAHNDEKKIIREGDSSDPADYAEHAERRQSAAAMNIISNPLKVNTMHLSHITGQLRCAAFSGKGKR